MARLAALVAAALILCGVAKVQAQGIESIGEFGAWRAYTFFESGNKVCFISSSPQKAEGDYTQRGDIFAMVTHRSGGEGRNVFSYEAGYPYKAESEVSVTVDGKPFKLFTRGGNAWTYDPKSDADLVQAMRAGATMVVKGTSTRDTLTTDTFSLIGFTKAHQAINEACPAE